MPISYTSRAALAQIIGDLIGRQREVYDAIANWISSDSPESGTDPERSEGPSIEDVAAKLGIKESSVCGRVNELLAAGAIECGPFKTNRTGHQAKTYRALVFKPYSPPPADAPQGDLFAGTLSRNISPYQTRI
jgi:hypothetical protein